MPLVSYLVLATFISLASEQGPILLFEEGPTYSKLHSEPAIAEEDFFGSVTSDGAGNHYTIEFDTWDDYLHPTSVIMKYPSSGEPHPFAVLSAPWRKKAWFEAIFCDRSGNMIVVVAVQRKGSVRMIQRRDYYLIEGMPTPQYGRRLALALGLAISFVMFLYFFRVLLALRFKAYHFRR